MTDTRDFYRVAPNGEYMGVQLVCESPLEPGEFRAPPDCIETAPPALAANQAAVYEAGAWTVKADWRGVKLYAVEGGASVDPITAIGVLPSSLKATNIAPPAAQPKTFYSFDGAKWVAKPDWRGVTLYKTTDGTVTAITQVNVTPASVSATDIAPPSPEHSWVNGTWAPDSIKLQAKFARIKADAIQAVADYHAAWIQAQDGNPTQAEKDTWVFKVETATAIIGGKTLTAQAVAFLNGAGITTDALKLDWATKVMANSAAHAMIIGIAEQIRKAANDAVSVATTEAAITAALAAQKSTSEAAAAKL